MPLSAGTRLGRYEVVGPLGAGGMGEVYRARDSRLGREVAVKVLPQHLSSDAEVRARFEREARTVSSLNHPHICTLFDIGNENGLDYLVMELIEGETLAARLARGPLPTPEVLKLSAQIAEALDGAHRAGVVHRDLKPGNIMLTKSGAKLMDFGLARAIGLVGSGADGNATTLAKSPTIAAPLTAEGTLVGTFQYMSPEQLEGGEADARSDLWALGCVLYEMATGRRAFDGKSQASVIGAIMTSEPVPIPTVAPMTPPAFDRLVRRCLAKDPDDRWQSARDVLHELRWISGDIDSQRAAAMSAPPSRPGLGKVRIASPRALLAWAALATLALVGLLLWVILRAPTAAIDPASIEFTLEPPPGYTFFSPSDPALSPDGRTVACIVMDAKETLRIAVRSLERAEIRVLPGTDGATLPFWSPDGRSIGFFSLGKLRKTMLDGSSPVAIADAPDARGGTWSQDGTIVFAPTAGGCVFAVPSSGGTPVQVTTLDGGREEVGHRYPCFLKDGRRFVFVAFGRSGKKWLCEASTAGGTSRALGETETAARWAPGWILTVDRRRVMAQRFDEGSRELKGTAVEIAQCGGIPKYGHPNLAAAANGTIVYQRPWVQKTRLRWCDPSGQWITPPTHEIESPLEIVLSPDHRSAAMTLASDSDIWLIALEQSVPKRLTFFNSPQFKAISSLVWSPDSRRIAYALGGAAGEVIHVISTETAADTVLFSAPNFFAVPQSWSNDGRQLVTLCTNPQGNFDIWTIPLENAQAAKPFLETPDYETVGQLSPDGRWFACATGVGGDDQIRIYSMDKPGVRYQLVLELTVLARPFWSDDGRTLILVDFNRQVVAVPVDLDGGFRQGTQRNLFQLPVGGTLVAVAPNLSRFLILDAEVQTNPAPLCVLTSWPQRLANQ